MCLKKNRCACFWNSRLHQKYGKIYSAFCSILHNVQSFWHQSVLFSAKLVREPGMSTIFILLKPVVFSFLKDLSSHRHIYVAINTPRLLPSNICSFFQTSIFIMTLETEKWAERKGIMFHSQSHFLIRKFPSFCYSSLFACLFCSHISCDIRFFSQLAWTFFAFCRQQA